jgi:hypothetical protein
MSLFKGVPVGSCDPEMRRMKTRHFINWSAAIWMSAAVLQAQETPESLSRQIKQLQEHFEKQQREMRESFERMIRDQQAQIETLKKELEATKTNAPQPNVTAAPSDNAPAAPTAAIAPSRSAAPGAVGAADLPAKWSPTDPIRFGGAQNYINLSFDALVAAGGSTANDIEDLELGGHDPKERGFTVQNLETILEGKIDPYFRGQANFVFQIDPHGETTFEAEEAYLETMSLPYNLQVKAGQFFSEFGRLNATHPHSWDFVDQPLVNGRFLGPDGLRSAGARLSYLLPTPFYSELFFAVQNSQGGTAFSFRNEHESELFFGRPAVEHGVRNVGDMLFVPRYAASFDITDSQTIVAGTSAAFGPNSSGADTDTQIYGVDLFWKWKSPQQHAGFPFVTWQTEGMMRRYKAGAFNWDLNGDGVADSNEEVDMATGLPAMLPEEKITDYGLYSQVAYGFRKGWVAAFRGDYVFPETRAEYESILGPDPDRSSRWRLSPNLTWYPSEFSKIRLQYNFDHRNGIGDDHSVWMQFEFLLGTHAAHKF